jgi:hypothetical protein
LTIQGDFGIITAPFISWYARIASRRTRSNTYIKEVPVFKSYRRAVYSGVPLISGIILLGCIVLSCSDDNPSGPTNDPPVITNLAASNELVPASGESMIDCEATDPNNDALSYSWTVAVGTVAGSGKSIIWTAPNTAGICWVKCTVSDGKGGQDTDSIGIEVMVPIPTDGLVAFYPFNGNANDESGNGNDGTVYGATLTADRFDSAQKTYSFIPDNYIVSTPVLPTGNQARSISAWFNTTSSSGSNGWNVNTVASWGSPSSNALCAIGVYKSKLMFGAFGTSYDVYTTAIVNDGNWHHAVVVYDGLVLAIYLDDSLLVSENRNLGTVNSAFYMGRRAGQVNQFMNGFVDDVRVYNRALTQAEIRALYHDGGWDLK